VIGERSRDRRARRRDLKAFGYKGSGGRVHLTRRARRHLLLDVNHGSGVGWPADRGGVDFRGLATARPSASRCAGEPRATACAWIYERDYALSLISSAVPRAAKVVTRVDPTIRVRCSAHLNEDRRGTITVRAEPRGSRFWFRLCMPVAGFPALYGIEGCSAQPACSSEHVGSITARDRHAASRLRILNAAQQRSLVGVSSSRCAAAAVGDAEVRSGLPPTSPSRRPTPVSRRVLLCPRISPSFFCSHSLALSSRSRADGGPRSPCRTLDDRRHRTAVTSSDGRERDRSHGVSRYRPDELLGGCPSDTRLVGGNES